MKIMNIINARFGCLNLSHLFCVRPVLYSRIWMPCGCLQFCAGHQTAPFTFKLQMVWTCTVL